MKTRLNANFCVFAFVFFVITRLCCGLADTRKLLTNIKIMPAEDTKEEKKDLVEIGVILKDRWEIVSKQLMYV